ncbi:uncharacterized protein LOC109598356 isoform X2 [Aethina tumida]|uniref:uncharacterized protein LOC109598356 isoform X2 n=1 Tax=Aethina tumida TaxID=116153 RepID=UPI002147BD83|nr:uncharacterized protein LOC109598356 isoform X2 [Aethina tumida]
MAMKLLSCFAACLLLLHSSYALPPNDVQTRGIFEKLINSTFNNLIAGTPEDISILNFNIPFNSHIVRGNISYDTLYVTGMKGLVASYIKVNILNMHLNMTILLPSLKVSLGKYNVDLNVTGHRIHRTGDVNFELLNSELTINSKVSFINGISLKDISVTPQLGTFGISCLPFKEIKSKIISEFVNTNLVPRINKKVETIAKINSSILEEIINAILR